MKLLFPLIVLLLCTPNISLAYINLNFDSAISGTINDTNGFGIGFTHRLPGSGASIPANDPYLVLDAANSRLLITSTQGNFNNSGFGRNLPIMEAPALLLTGIGSKDFAVKALFRGLTVPDLSDQIGIFIGSSVDNVFRAGVHDGYQSFGINSINGTDTSPSMGTLAQFQPNDDAIFELGREHGEWYFKWKNLTTPANSGSLTNIPLPALSSENDLYVGIFNHDARNFVSQTVELDYFLVVPEPSSLSLFFIALVCMITRRGQK